MMRLSMMRIAEGDRLMWWQGVAWVDPMRQSAVVLPIPLNLVVGVLRRVWFFLRCPEMFKRPTDLEVQWVAHGRRLQREEMVVKARYSF